jgi:hypothetical protein
MTIPTPELSIILTRVRSRAEIGLGASPEDGVALCDEIDRLLALNCVPGEELGYDDKPRTD